MHLCVSVVSGEVRGRRRRGVASGFLGFDALSFGPVEASIQTSHFRLPEDPKTPENAAELWRWFQDGAHFFVCGDATRMARDVDATLRKMAVTEGGLTETQAKDWIVSLARQGRYKRDIY